jgi:hypothetical protein
MVLQTPLIEESGINRAIRLAQQFEAPGEMIKLSDALARGPGPDDTEPVTIVPRPRFGREDFIAAVIDRLGGVISPPRLHSELGGNDVISLRELRKLKDSMLEEISANSGTLLFRGTVYRVQTYGRGYRLTASEQGDEPESRSDSHSDNALIRLSDPEEESTVETA